MCQVTAHLLPCPAPASPSRSGCHPEQSDVDGSGTPKTSRSAHGYPHDSSAPTAEPRHAASSHDATLAGATAVVIDVLRASTTIVTALAHGACHVTPVPEVATARALQQAQGSTNILLGGERGGQRIAGFDLDNSPCSYTPEAVSGKHIVFTTSHGTRAIAWSASASRVLIASFANLSAVVRELAPIEGDIHLVCSGTDNHPSVEDTLCAAVIAGQIWERRGRPQWRDDTALMLLELYRANRWSDDAHRLQVLSAGRGGQRLTRLGFQQDIAYACQLDRFAIVPWLEMSYRPARIVALPA